MVNKISIYLLYAFTVIVILSDFNVLNSDFKNLLVRYILLPLIILVLLAKIYLKFKK